LCGSTCIDTSTDPDHCGDCNQRCRPPANAVVQGCQAGDCIYACDEGYYDLNDNIGDPSADGCEADCKPSNNGVEACDQIDNDCDGTVDEGCDCNPGDLRDCGQSEGACELGTQECRSDGSWGACENAVGPQSETCDNIDNDCDGTIDENLERACGTNEGACAQGTQACSAGNWGTCDGGVRPATETCDGQDNDCDGSIDEDFGNKDNPCSEGVGACERSGALVCNSSGGGLVCDATPGNPSTETCDGIDNDCDGTVDEDLTRTCGTNTGVCSEGTETCSSGSWGSCQGATSPSTETCDGQDNDCDGTVDENVKTTYYFDGDGDGYGTSSSRTRCSPTGDYTATQTGDCDDSDSNIYPGAESLFCSESVDYDCDGVTGCSESDCNDGDGCSTSNALGTCSGNTCDTGGGGNCTVICGTNEECICGGTQCCPIGQNCLCR
ncbi:MAG: MopE-related protein, partial [Myxococcota bacterium]